MDNKRIAERLSAVATRHDLPDEVMNAVTDSVEELRSPIRPGYFRPQPLSASTPSPPREQSTATSEASCL